jgi:PPOX class probable FMN-dependent enzyme
MRSIFHIAPESDWMEAARGGMYSGDTLSSEGFIHCSDWHQVVRVANRFFRGRADMCLLRIDPEKLKAPLRYENLEGGDELFPHVYGSLNVDAVAAVSAFRPSVDGTFDCHRDSLNEEDAMNAFDRVVGSEAELRQLLGVPGARSIQKERATIDAHVRAFIARSPMLLLATAGADGSCDVSPKGDAPGFVLVLDERRLVIPDRPGNKRLDGMKNILANPRIGLLFLVPGREETVRINGRAVITRDPSLLERLTAHGKTPLLAIGVEVEQCFMHCSKAFRRSQLWSPKQWPAADALPSMACVLFDQIQPENVTLAEYERDIEESAVKHLY